MEYPAWHTNLHFGDDAALASGQLPATTPAVVPLGTVVMAAHTFSLQHLVWSALNFLFESIPT
jgi:hypothetical protein